SALPPVLWGVALTNFITGMPIDGKKEMVGGFLQFLHPFALLGGVMFLLLCIVHGLQFITIRTEGELRGRDRYAWKMLAHVTLIGLLVYIITAFVKTDIFTYYGPFWIILPISVWAALAAASFLNLKWRDCCAFPLAALKVGCLDASPVIG